MLIEDKLNISVVIPTWNRSNLVDRLLESLMAARNRYKYGDTEVLIVDSSQGSEKEQIVNSCEKYDARYIEGPDSVRKKRNKGIVSAKFEYILFIDSDVTVCEELMNLHAETFINSDDIKLGGSFGVTEFVGETSLLWKIIQYSTFVDSFSFAKRFPYQNWTIGNNVMFRKAVLVEINMFEEAFPFKLGGDDLDMTYRVTKAGYRIRSVPEAVTWHSRETWNHIAAVNDRTKRWGSMEYYLSRRHPEIFITSGIKTEFFYLVMLFFAVVASFVTGNARPMAAYGVLFTFSFLCIFLMDAKMTGKKNIFYYSVAKIFEARYYFFHVVEALKHGSLDGIYKSMSFSFYQTRAMLVRESRKLWILVWSIIIAGAFYLLL